jgi:hypothetical protein
MSVNHPSAIRLTITKEVAQALKKAKSVYPTLSDAEILKLGLSAVLWEVATLEHQSTTAMVVRESAAHAVGEDYLADPDEDIYQLKSKKDS